MAAPDPYVRKNPGDIILSADWNDIQVQGRTALQSHTHTGDAQGPKLTGAAIDPASVLAVQDLSVAGDLKVRGTVLLDQINALNALVAGPDGMIEAKAGLALDNNDLRLRAPGDTAHVLRHGGRPFAGQSIDGALLYGTVGGGLGATGDGERVALTWNEKGDVGVFGEVAAGGAVTAGNSDMYFTKTDHTHTGKGNAPGNAAIENDGGQWNALMILGRSTGADRRVRVFDHLSVEGRLRCGNLRAEVSSVAQLQTQSQQWTDMDTSLPFSLLEDANMLVVFKAPEVQAWPGIPTLPAANMIRAYFRLMLDDTPIASTAHEFHNNGWELRDVTLVKLLMVHPGSHTFHVQWFVNGPPGSWARSGLYGGTRHLMAVEL